MKTKKQNKNKMNYSVYYTIFRTPKGNFVYFGSGDRYEPTRRTWQFNHDILTNKRIRELESDYWGVETHKLLEVKTKKLAEGIEYELIGIFSGSDKELNLNGSQKKHRGRNKKKIIEALEWFVDMMLTGAPFYEDLKILAEMFFESQQSLLEKLEK